MRCVPALLACSESGLSQTARSPAALAPATSTSKSSPTIRISFHPAGRAREGQRERSRACRVKRADLNRPAPFWSGVACWRWGSYRNRGPEGMALWPHTTGAPAGTGDPERPSEPLGGRAAAGGGTLPGPPHTAGRHHDEGVADEI